MSNPERPQGRPPASVTGASAGDTISSLLPRAVYLHQQGDFEEAKVLYQKLLKIDPRHADGLQYYGILCHQSGDSRRAAELIRQAIDINPGVAPYYDNLGSVLIALEQFSQALAVYEKAEDLQPGDPDRHHDRGIVLQNMGRLDEALGAFQAALQAYPRDADSYFCLGNVYKAKGCLMEAETAYRQALAIHPEHQGAGNNLGNVLQELGHLEASESCFRDLLIAHSDNAQAHYNLASVLHQQGRVAAAVVHFKTALEIEPGFTEARMGSARANESLGNFQTALAHYQRLSDDSVLGAEACSGLLRVARFYSPPHYDFQFSTVLLAAIEAEQIPANYLARALAKQWRLKVMMVPEALEYDGQILEFAINGGSDPLLLTLLRSAINLDPIVERWLTRLRRILLFSHEELYDLASLQVALAMQCFHNDYVFALDAAEQARLEELRRSVQQHCEPGSRALLQLACYQPLYQLPVADVLLAVDETFWPRQWRELIAVSLQQPYREAELATSVSVLDAVTDPVSVQVRAQYEQSPYPRWLALPRAREGGLSAQLHRVLDAEAAAQVMAQQRSRILVAGCGTGQEALALAQLAPQSRVLGLDLSRTSLAYAQRMAEATEIGNVEFMQGDLLRLPGAIDRLGGPFDLIASSGVLHHMRDPLAGWRALVRVLAPGGLMKIALYSRLARETITRAHARIEALHLPADNQGVRAFRQRLMQGREVGVESLVDSEDFYTTNTCTDLLFHVLEHSFEIPQLQQMLDELALEFLGFELPHSGTRQDFLRQYPHQYRDLPAWTAYEAAHPDTFEAMYVIWCRKANTPG